MAMTNVFKFKASVRTETTHQLSKVAAAKFFFSSAYVMELTCHLITERHFFIKVWRQFDIFATAILFLFLKQVGIFHYLYNVSAVPRAKFENKAIVYKP